MFYGSASGTLALPYPVYSNAHPEFALEELVRKSINQWKKITATDQGPVVQSIVSLATSLRRQLVKYILTTLSNMLLFFVGKMIRTFFFNNNYSIFDIFTFEILTKR